MAIDLNNRFRRTRSRNRDSCFSTYRKWIFCEILRTGCKHVFPQDFHKVCTRGVYWAEERGNRGMEGGQACDYTCGKLVWVPRERENNKRRRTRTDDEIMKRHSNCLISVIDKTVNTEWNSLAAVRNLRARKLPWRKSFCKILSCNLELKNGFLKWRLKIRWLIKRKMMKNT